MPGAEIIFAVTLLLVLLGAIETVVHRLTLRRMPIRVHVNGTRGKSSVTRLIAAGLREAGIVTCAKTTGTLARMILPDGRELPVYRPARPNVIEQIRIVRVAAAFKARALVVECMALQPELQWLSEGKLLRATHGVITNARPDHLEIMGPEEKDVVAALCGMIPARQKIFTAETKLLEQIKAAAADRQAQLISLEQSPYQQISDEDMAGFCYTEHKDNVGLALAVCADLGVERQVALRGMQKAAPDPGALTEHVLDFFGRRLIFVNGFAANDPVSTKQIWDWARTHYADVDQHVAIFNCRDDRPDRSIQLGAAIAHWDVPDKIVLMGSGTYLFARAAVAAGMEADRFVFAEEQRVEEIFESAISLVGNSALIMGMGNIGGQGLELVRFFRNRAAPSPLLAAYGRVCTLDENYHTPPAASTAVSNFRRKE